MKAKIRMLLWTLSSSLLLSACPVRGEEGLVKNQSVAESKPSKPELFSSYLTSKESQEALAMLDSSPGKAATAFSSLAEKSTGEEQQHYQFLAAIGFSRAGKHKDAAALFEKLQPSYTRLAGYAAVFGAESFLLSKDYEKAIALTKTVSTDERIFRRALRARAEALDAMTSTEALSAYETLVSAWPDVSPEVYERLAALRLAYGDKEGAAKALRKALSRWPSSKDVEARQKALLRIDPKASFSLEEQEERARMLFALQKHKESEEAYSKLAEQAPKESVLRCQALFWAGKSVQRQRDHARAASLFESAAVACKDKDITFRRDALYNQGKSLQSAKKYEDAEKAYAQVEEEFPTETLADDARLHRGNCLLARGENTAEAVLLSLADAYPKGDMAEEGVWVVAWDKYQKGDLDAAAAVLEKASALHQGVTNFWAEGRLLYWLGRIREKQGDAVAANVHFEAVRQAYPLSYYAQLALLRLNASKSGQLLWQTPSVERLPLEIGAVFREKPSFQRGLELLRLGLIGLAQEEFSDLAAGDEDSLWMLAELLDQAGLYTSSHNIPRRKLPKFRFSDPSRGVGLRRWEIAYPAVYRDLMEKWSEKNKTPAALSMAIMREESGFDKDIESFAHAYGLMQLIMPTAQRQAKALQITLAEDGLRDPETNITLGTRYLGWLVSLYKGHVGYAVASYNAGEGAVQKWQKSFGEIPFDEFVERIPYEETQRYTKRVLASYGVYSYLYGFSYEPFWF